MGVQHLLGSPQSRLGLGRGRDPPGWGRSGPWGFCDTDQGQAIPRAGWGSPRGLWRGEEQKPPRAKKEELSGSL